MSSSLHSNGVCTDGRTSPAAGKSVNNGDSSNGGGHVGEATDDVKASQQHIRNLEAELKHAHEALAALKTDRKRLKTEKFDVLNQMKQLYATLEDKEKELRDFIRTYEKRMRESEFAIRQLIIQRDEAEREKWTILRHARDEAQRSLSLTTQLAARDAKIHQLQEELSQLRSQVRPLAPLPLPGQPHLPGLRTSPTVPYATTQSHYHQSSSAAANRRNHHHQRSSISSMDSAAIVSDAGGCDEPLYSRIDHSSIDSHQHHQLVAAPSNINNNPETPTNGGASSGAAALVDQLMADVDSLSTNSIVPGSLPSAGNSGSGEVGFHRKPDGLSSQQHLAAESTWKSADQLSLGGFGSKTLGRISSKNKSGSGMSSYNNNGGAWGSISRVFSRATKQRKNLDLSLYQGSAVQQQQPKRDSSRRSWSPRGSICSTPLAEETDADRFRFWEEAQNLAVDRWKAGHVLAWLEFGMGMARYLSACAENIKSGKVLLELTDAELEAGLHLSHPLHKKKIRLAVEERRIGNPVRYPLIASLENGWVANEWLADVGLTQYAEAFNACMMDARMLDNLTKRELEKHLGVTRKAHQASIVHGITFLRMMRYDRQAINERRRQCEIADCDPLVWTNQRFIDWARHIDLAEYAENLKESGIHGALVVLDPTFTADVMASALAIPNSKNIIRRHLTSEFEALVQISRARYEQRARQARAERKRLEKVENSVGRNISRSFTTGLAFPTNDRHDSWDEESNLMGPKSIRASLSRAFGRKIKQERLLSSSTSAEGNGPAMKEQDNFAAVGGAHQHVPSSSTPFGDGRSWTVKKSPSPSHQQLEKHRRVKSSSDIENINVTRV